MASVIVDSPTTDGAPKKLRRITRACDYCHKRSIRCRFPGDTDDTRCQNCVDFDQPCRFDRVVKRRGAKPRSQTISSDSTPPSRHGSVGEDVCRTPSIAAPHRHAEWKAPPIASQSLILERVEIYFEIVYPIFPFFHRPTLRRRIARGDNLKDRFFFAATMAICALVTARIADRAVYNPRWDLAKLSQIRSEVFYAAAVKECGNAGALEQANFDLLRTCALLAVTAIQYGKFREMQTHLGKYHTLVAMDGLHDEENWPSDIGIVEVEERRRLFWSMYTLDIYSSIFWNGVIRCREQQSNVSFTTEIDDDCFDDTGYRIESPSSADTPMTISNTAHLPFDIRSSSWLYGWNFMTDLYRIMEHVMAEFRDWRRNKRPLVGGIFSDHSTLSASNARDAIMSMYNNLPQCFKETNEITCDPSRDRYGFQAANITATVQLLRMVLFSSGGASIEERCNIASEVVGAFMRIPVQYLQAISSPLLHHLAGIGSILGTVFEKPLTESGYLQLRVVLLALAQLLENLDHGVHSTASADKLRNIVAKLDTQMEHQRQTTTISPYTKPPHPNTLRTATASPFTISHGHSTASHSTGSSRQDSFSTGSRDSMDPTGHVHHGNVPFVVSVPPDIRQGWPQGWGYDFMQFPES